MANLEERARRHGDRGTGKVGKVWLGTVVAGCGHQLKAQARTGKGGQRDMHNTLGHNAITRKPMAARYIASQWTALARGKVATWCRDER